MWGGGGVGERAGVESGDQSGPSSENPSSSLSVSLYKLALKLESCMGAVSM